MKKYGMAVVLGVLGFASSLQAEPITWSFTAVNADTGELFGSGYNITDKHYISSNLITKSTNGNLEVREEPSGHATYYTYSTTTRTRLTITDEASGESGSRLLNWFWTESWVELGNDPTKRGHTSAGTATPYDFEPSWLRLGNNDYLISTGGSYFYVMNQPAAAPEPATLLMGGLGLVAVGLVRRRHKRAKSAQSSVVTL